MDGTAECPAAGWTAKLTRALKARLGGRPAPAGATGTGGRGGDPRASARERAYDAGLSSAEMGRADPGDAYADDTELRVEFLRGRTAGLDRRRGGDAPGDRGPG